MPDPTGGRPASAAATAAPADVPAAVAALSAPFALRGRTVRNRVAVPPMVVCGLHPDGAVTDGTVAHYERLAAGGAGLLIQEATCVAPDGKLAPQQLGLWEDAQADGCRRIVEACRPHGPVLLVQIHHSPVPQDLPTDGVARLAVRFVEAAVRAERAGYDGVELHGAHGYLLSRFLSPSWNRRKDRYGEPLRLVAEIVEGIRASTGKDFLLGIRIGADSPGLETGIAHSVALDRMGIDLLDVSAGHRGPDDPAFEVPCDFGHSELAYRASRVKPHVRAPVVGVGGLDDPAEAASYVAAGHADFAAVGRGHLVDPAWTRKVLAGQPFHACMDCPACKWFRQHASCPGRLRAEKLEGRT